MSDSGTERPAVGIGRERQFEGYVGGVRGAYPRAPAAEGVLCRFPNQASRPGEECARAMGDAPRWFQLYWSTSNELVASLVSRAEACGCGAIVLTLDTTML